MLLHKKALTPETWSTTGIDTKRLLHQRPCPNRLYVFLQKRFDTRRLVHSTSWTPLAHKPKGLQQQNLYTKLPLHQKMFKPHLTQNSFQKTYKPNSLYIRSLLHQKICKPNSIYRRLLHQGAFRPLHQNTFTSEGFCTRKLSHRKPFTPNSFTTLTPKPLKQSTW